MIKRTNMLLRQAETWRPLAFTASPTGIGRAILALRRFLDLQTASIWRDLKAELPEVKGTVVDVGCGAQPYRPLFQSAVTYIGIDTEEAKAHFDYEVPDTRYYRGIVWPVESHSADLILCTETLEHVPETKPFLAEAARVLKPGGRILFTVPFAARWHYIPYDYWRFTPSSLSALLAEAGLRNISVYARGNEITVACYKNIAVMLPFILPQGKKLAVRFALQLVGLFLLPALFLNGLIAGVSLRGQGGDDCLGYTATAEKGTTSQEAAVV
jgi:SAM-dependent methyltransferase